MFIDSHCHLEKEYYPDIDKVISASKNLSVNLFITAGTNALTNKEAIDCAHKHNEVFACVGIHPEFQDNYTDEDIEKLKEYIKDDKVIAIGEIGLDYHYEGFDKDKQITLLEKQLKLAEEYRLPVVIHSRDATEDTITTLKKYKVKGVIHSFSGSKETAQIYIKMGYKLGINGVVTFKNAHIKEVIKDLGLENFILETDSPYLTPVPFRGSQNIPGNIKYIVDFLSEYLGISPWQIAKITRENTYIIFDKLNK